MRVILSPYLSIRAASAVVDLSESALRRGCRNGKVPHVRRSGRIYIDMVALLGKLSVDQQGGCGEGGDRTGIGGDGELGRKSAETVKKK